jgi:hypothetical protein
LTAEAINYVVVCACTGQIEAIAYIDDNRPIGGSITVTAPDPAMKQIISAIGYHPQVENWRAPDGYVASKWAERNVSETVWDWDTIGTGPWVIRCARCQAQAQMSRANMERIADRLALSAAQGDLVSVPAPEPRESADPVDGWEDGTLTDPEWRQRYVIQLGVLVRESQRNG